VTGEGRAVAGRYRLVERIGSGAMGVVWRAHDERLHRTVAVKELLLAPGLSTGETDEAIQRAMREGRIAARLHHPNAISVFDVVEEDGVPCLVMEYLPSRSLSAVMAERGALPPREVARIGAQVAAALAAAHSAGIVHRDIKPGNVLLGDDGTVKITDFGISRATDDVTVTKTGLIAGTPAYLAPEVALGRDPAPPSDVFSLGSTLYAAVEGEPPFGLSENTLGLLHAVAAGQINPPQHAGPLADVLRYLLRADPTERPTAGKTRDVLHAVADGRIPDVPVVGPDAATSLLADETARYAQGTQVLGDSPNQAPTQHVGGGTRAQTAPVPPGRPSGKRRKGLVLSGLALAALLIAGLLLAPMLFNHKGQGQQPVDNRPTGAVPNPLPPAPTGVVEETTTRHTTKATTTSQQPVTSERPTTTTTSERPTTTSQQPTTTSKTTSSPPTTGTTSPTS
jgi:serine/threonine protein kinase